MTATPSRANLLARDRSTTDLASLTASLSFPFVNAESQGAAQAVATATNAEDVLGGLLSRLLAGKSLHTALVHLENAGMDLDRFHPPPEQCTTTWPPDMDFIWPLNPPSFVFRPNPRPPRRSAPVSTESGTGLVRILQRHRKLLADHVLMMLNDVGPERFVLLSGRAFEVRFPDYDTRMSYDTDVRIPSLEDAAEVIRVGCNELGGQLAFLHLRAGTSVTARGALVWERSGHLVTFGFAVGGNQENALWRRSEALRWRGQAVRAISPEDLLLQTAAKHRMGVGFTLANISDVQVILASGELDFTYIAEQARSNHLSIPLLAILAAAGQARAPTHAPIWATDPIRGAELKLAKYKRRALLRSFEEGFGANSNGLSSTGFGRLTLARHPYTLLCGFRNDPLDSSGCRAWGAEPERVIVDEVARLVSELPVSSGPIPHQCERFALDRRLVA